MKNKQSIFYFLVFLILLISSTGCNNDVKKAKEYIKAGMYSQAIELLNKRINEKPRDADAHLQLGICHINQCNYIKADERFRSAVAFKPKYKNEIGKKYKSAGILQLSKGQYSDAYNLFSKSIKYDSSHRNKIAEICFNEGLKNLYSSCFNMAIEFEPELNMKVYNFIMDKGDKAYDNGCAKFYIYALNYGGKESPRSQLAGERLLSISKKIKDINDPKLEEYRENARKFIKLPYDKSAKFYYDLAWKYFSNKEYDQAINEASKVIEICPNYGRAYGLRGAARRYKATGEYELIFSDLNKDWDLSDELDFSTLMHLKQLLAICPDVRFRDGNRALELALTDLKRAPDAPGVLADVAAAYAEIGKFEDAIKTQEKAITSLNNMYKDDNAKEKVLPQYIERLNYYKAHKPWREK